MLYIINKDGIVILDFKKIKSKSNYKLIIMKEIYNLTNDYLFKRIFKDKRYLKHLLLTFFCVRVNKIEYLNTELIKDNLTSKVGIVDLLLKLDDRITILEF